MSRQQSRDCLDQRRYERRQTRRLNCQLRDLEAIEVMQRKNFQRHESGIRRDLWRLMEDKKRIQVAKAKKEMLVSKAKKEIQSRDSKELRLDGQRTPSLSAIESQKTFNPSSRLGSRDKILTPSFEQLKMRNKPQLTRDKPDGQLKTLRLSAAKIKISVSDSNQLRRVKTESRTYSAKSPSQPLVVYEKQETSNDMEKQHIDTGKSQKDRGSIDPSSTIKVGSKHQLEKYLLEQGLDPDTFSDEIIAMRNLGKSTDEIWQDVRHCRYLRGYDPPVMKVGQQDVSEFVFGEPLTPDEESYKQHLWRVTQLVDAVKIGGRRQSRSRNQCSST